MLTLLTSVANLAQLASIADIDPGSGAALLLIAIAIAAVLSLLPEKRYTCKECGYSTRDREQAAGHVHLSSLHKIDL